MIDQSLPLRRPNRKYYQTRSKLDSKLQNLDTLDVILRKKDTPDVEVNGKIKINSK
jgi:hypothetical protein